MERTNIKNAVNLHSVDAIFTSDWHLRDTVPPCRTDDFEIEQWGKVRFIMDLARTYDAPILHAGDLFHTWKPSPYLLSMAMNNIHPMGLLQTIYGNHDLPQHNILLAVRCGVNTLINSHHIRLARGVHWNTELTGGQFIEIKGRRILLWHIMTYQGKEPFPGCTDVPAGGLLRKHRQFDVILTGHNHKTFVEELDGRLLVNPGCITRQEADKADFKPCVFLYCAKTNTVKKVFIPIEQGVVSKTSHVVDIEERNTRIDAFISRLNTDWDSSIDFVQNVGQALALNPVTKEVKSLINKALEQ